MKTDQEIEMLLRIQDGTFQKLYDAREEIRTRLLTAKEGISLLAIIQEKIHQTMLLFIDRYRLIHSKTEKE